MSVAEDRLMEAIGSNPTVEQSKNAINAFLAHEENQGEDRSMLLQPIFIEMIELNKDHVVDALLQMEPSLLRAAAPDNQSLLHYALSEKSLHAATVLVNAGVDVNERDVNSKTPLMNVVSNWDSQAPDVSSKLLTAIYSKRPDMNARDADGKTAVDMAASKGDTELVKTLVAMGGKPTMYSEVDVNNMLSALGAEPVKLTFGEELKAFFVGVFTQGTSWEETRGEMFAAKASLPVDHVVNTQEIKDLSTRISNDIKEMNNVKEAPALDPDVQREVNGIVKSIIDSQENIKPTDQPDLNQKQDKDHGQGR